jgi:hypothetical protein
MGVQPMNQWKTRIIAGLAALAFAGAAEAGPIIDWDPIFFYGSGMTFNNQPIGSVLNAVGTVSDFNPPFDFLDASDPTKEYTIVISGLVSQGTVTTGAPGLQFYSTEYTGGTIQIIEDLSPDHDYGVNPPNATAPPTFQDGTVLLSGSFTSFTVTTNDFTQFQVGNAEGDISWTGGSLIDLTVTGGEPCPGLFTGGLTWRPSTLIEGYLFRHDGKIDLNCPVPAEASSWGKVKAQYR